MDDEKELLNKNAEINEAEEQTEEYGDIRVASEVVSIVASLAAQEVPGVLRMSGRRIDGINEFLGKESVYKGVRVSFDNKTVTCNVYVIIEYGFCSVSPYIVSQRSHLILGSLYIGE